MAVSGLRDHLGLGVSRVGAAGLTLVFCEVKCRSGLGFGHPLEAITYTKMRTLRQLAAVWMREHRTNGVEHPAGCHRSCVGAGSGAVPDPCSGGGLGGFCLCLVGGSGWARGPHRRGGGRPRGRAAAKWACEDIRQRHQLVTGLQRHDHLLSWRRLVNPGHLARPIDPALPPAGQLCSRSLADVRVSEY